jgi:hypothetical protein
MTAAVIVYGFSLLAKAIGVSLPLVLLVLDVYPLRRLGGGPGKWFGPVARRVWWEKLPFLLLAVAAGVVAPFAVYQTGTMRPLEQYGVAPRVAQALFGLAFYLWKTVAPLRLSPLYELPPHLDPWDWPFLLSGVVVLGISAALFVARERWPAGLAIWISYSVILAPVLGIAQNGPQIAADRYSYLSCLGWAILSGAGVLYFLRRWLDGHIARQGFGLATALAAVFLLGLGALTWKQLQVWHDTETLWRYVLALDPKSSSAHSNLGSLLESRGDLEEAIAHYREALKINPASATAQYNLGNALASRNELEEAIAHYRAALKIDPDFAEAYNNLGNALARQGK